MKLIHLTTIAFVGLAACQTTTNSGGNSVDRDAALSATTPTQLTALGARKLGAADFNSELVGKTLDEAGKSNWTWNINSDGTSSSRADDGSWETSSTWDLSGNQYCRQSADNPRKCSDVYELGGIYRFTEAPGELAGWAVVVQ